MKARLIIQNFGPIDDLDIEISKFNILIGPHASGKSTMSKVLCIIHSCYDELLHKEEFTKPNDRVVTKFSNVPRFEKLLINYRIENFLRADTYIFFEDNYFFFEFNLRKRTDFRKNEAENINRSQSYYIPAERIALPMISESLFELTLEQSTLPNYFLQFGRDFTIARRNQKLFNLPILNVEFENRDGRNVVILSNC